MNGARFITQIEHEFYSTMLRHYKERTAALPDVKFLKRTTLTIKKILTTKRIHTYEET